MKNPALAIPSSQLQSGSSGPPQPWMAQGSSRRTGAFPTAVVAAMAPAPPGGGGGPDPSEGRSKAGSSSASSSSSSSSWEGWAPEPSSSGGGSPPSSSGHSKSKSLLAGESRSRRPREVCHFLGGLDSRSPNQAPVVAVDRQTRRRHPPLLEEAWRRC